jgi:hypothetical protein
MHMGGLYMVGFAVNASISTVCKMLAARSLQRVEHA